MCPFISDTPLKHVPADYHLAGDPRWYLVEKGRDRGKQLYYTDRVIGQGGQQQTLLVVHGNPECSYIFNKVIKTLLTLELPRTRLITLDHIGFGLSSQATELIGPAGHVSNLSELLEQLALTEVTMVVHDWGGPIGLGAMLEQPEQLRNLVILNSGIFPLSPKCNYRNYPFPLLSWARMSSLVPNRHWGHVAAGAIACRAVSAGSLLWNLLGYLMRSHKHRVENNPYADQFASPANAASSKYLASLAGRWCEIDKHGNSELNALYARLQKEVEHCWGTSGSGIHVRLLCGEWDALGNRANARLWLQALPQLEKHMRFYPGCGHFLPESHPADIASTIYELLTLPGLSG